MGDDWPEDYVQDLIPTDTGPEAEEDGEPGTEEGDALEAAAAAEPAEEGDVLDGDPEAAAPPTVPRPCSCTVKESWVDVRKHKRVSA